MGKEQWMDYCSVVEDEERKEWEGVRKEVGTRVRFGCVSDEV